MYKSVNGYFSVQTPILSQASSLPSPTVFVSVLIMYLNLKGGGINLVM